MRPGPAARPVRLRGHHLLCLLSYVGKGYDPDFVANLDRIADRIAGGAPVVLVQGPDDICAPLAADPAAHCHRVQVAMRDRRAAADVGAVLRRPLRPGARLAFMARLAAMRRAFATGRSRTACAGCPWHALCTSVARGGFAGARVAPPAVGRPEGRAAAQEQPGSSRPS
ncbi:MAG: DUF1284 domain-containing protein [Amaricoccus sp.]